MFLKDWAFLCYTCSSSGRKTDRIHRGKRDHERVEKCAERASEEVERYLESQRYVKKYIVSCSDESRLWETFHNTLSRINDRIVQENVYLFHSVKTVQMHRFSRCTNFVSLLSNWPQISLFFSFFFRTCPRSWRKQDSRLQMPFHCTKFLDKYKATV